MEQKLVSTLLTINLMLFGSIINLIQTHLILNFNIECQSHDQFDSDSYNFKYQQSESYLNHVEILSCPH